MSKINVNKRSSGSISVEVILPNGDCYFGSLDMLKRYGSLNSIFPGDRVCYTPTDAEAKKINKLAAKYV
jgi:hypothetical protein